ncbi:MAG: serine/threonine protein kinase [Cyanobacteriota bacterium]|nr:serine/threonine protein kinase [Cyanobacteriota bacterium]
MTLCINPSCPQPEEPLNNGRLHCLHCGSPLVFNEGYRAIALLQEDDLSKLYELRDDLGCSQVLQVLSVENPRAISLLQQQARVLALADHPGVPTVEPDGYLNLYPNDDSRSVIHALAMEKIDGMTLGEWFQGQNSQPIAERIALDWLGQLVEILDCLHRHLYFHRDIRPQNIRVRENGTLALVNFGSFRDVAIAYLVSQTRSLVPHPREIETLHSVSAGYTPREQVQGKGVPQSDFFALGRTWVYLLTGKPPTDFPEDPRTGELLWQHRASHISPDFIDLLDWMMSPRASDRPHSAAAILSPLQRLVSQRCEFQPISTSLKARSRDGSTRLSRSDRAKSSKFKAVLLWGGSLMLLSAIATRVDWSSLVKAIAPHVEFESEQQSP